MCYYDTNYEKKLKILHRNKKNKNFHHVFYFILWFKFRQGKIYTLGK